MSILKESIKKLIEEGPVSLERKNNGKIKKTISKMAEPPKNGVRVVIFLTEVDLIYKKRIVYASGIEENLKIILCHCDMLMYCRRKMTWTAKIFKKHDLCIS